MMKKRFFILAFFPKKKKKNACYNITHNCVYLHCVSSLECFILFLRSPHLIARLRHWVCFHCTWFWWAKCGDRETIHSLVLKDKATETFILYAWPLNDTLSQPQTFPTFTNGLFAACSLVKSCNLKYTFLLLPEIFKFVILKNILRCEHDSWVCCHRLT